jgi:predicted PurR-regulated permease PerM
MKERARPAGKRPRRNPRVARQQVDETFTVTAIAALGAVIIFFYLVRSILLPFVLAGVVGYVATPAIEFATRQTHLPRLLWAFLIFSFIVTLAALLCWLSLPVFAQGAGVIAGDLRETIESLVHQVLGDNTVHLLGQPMNSSQIAEAMVTMARDWVGQDGRLFGIALNSAAGVFGLFLTSVLLFYFLVAGPSIARGLLGLVPPNRRPLMLAAWSKIDPLLKRYFIGVLIIVLYAAVAAYLGLGLILGIRHAALLALITGLLEMLPLIGPISAILIASFAAIRAAHSPWDLVGYAVFATTLRLSIDQWVGPLVLGRAARVHPVLIIFCFLAGATLFGVSGIILAIPVVLIVRSLLAMFYGDMEVSAPVGVADSGGRDGEHA